MQYTLPQALHRVQVYSPALLRERVLSYRRVMPTVIVCQNLTAGYSSHDLHPGWERVFLVLVVELVMERGGAEGLKHQATAQWCRRLGNIRINILYDPTRCHTLGL